MLHQKLVIAIVFSSLLASAPSRLTLAVESVRATGNAIPMQSEKIEFFAAIDSRSIEVTFIPSDSRRAKVIVKNLTDKPLSIVLPRSFAGVPVLGQLGFPGGQGLGLPGGGNIGVGAGGPGGQLGAGQGGASQALGGGFGQGQQIGGNGLGPQGAIFGGGGNGGINAGGPGFFRVEPDKIRKLDVATVCLEHGKLDPNGRMPYRIVPLTYFTLDARINALCEQLAAGSITQNVAQAAAWNLANGLSWESLASKDRKVSKYTGREKYFSKAELALAKQLASHCSGFSHDRSADTPTKSEEIAISRKNQ